MRILIIGVLLIVLAVELVALAEYVLARWFPVRKPVLDVKPLVRAGLVWGMPTRKAVWLALLVPLAVGAPAMASELYVYGAIGQASSPLTHKPGLWRHEGQPYEFDGKTMGFRTGLGMGTTLGLIGTPAGIPVQHGLRIELGAVSLGSPEMVESWFNADESYRHGRCVTKCHELYALNLVNDYLGAEVVGKYGVTAWDWLEVYTTAGFAGFSHRHSGALTATWLHPVWVGHFPEKNMGQNWAGMMLAGVIGGGVCGKAGPVSLCGDVEKFLPMAQTANPLVGSGGDGPVLTTFQVRVPFWRSKP